MITRNLARAAAAVALPAALATLSLFAADAAWALTVTPPPPCIIELKSPLTTWASANCGTASSDPSSATVISNISDTATPTKGVTLVKWTASLSGETASAWQAVIVADTAPPTIGIPRPTRLEATGATTPSPPAFGNAASVTASGHTSVTCDPTKPLKMGVTRIVCTAKDSEDNSVASTWAAVVKDTTPPTIPALKKTNVEATGAQSLIKDLTFVKPAAADLVTATPDLSVAFLPTSLPLGNATITWIATDGAGNSATALQNVTLVDTAAPTIAAPATVPVLPTTAIGTPQVLDLVDPHPDLTLSNTGTTQNPSVTWTATDSRDNSSTLVQTTSRPDTDQRFTATKLRTLDKPTHISQGLAITALTKDILFHVAFSNPPSASGLVVYNTTTGSVIEFPANSKWSNGGHLVPLRSNADDTRFAMYCTCGSSGSPKIHIFNVTMPNPIHTLTPPQSTDGSTVYHGLSAVSSGDTLFIHASMANPTQPSLGRTSSVHAYDTTTWKLKYEIKNPSPSFNDHFGELLLVSQGASDSEDELYVWSRQSKYPPSSSPEIQVFDTSDGRLIRTLAQMSTPWVIFATPYPDGYFVPDAVLPSKPVKVINHKSDGSVGTMHAPNCCPVFFGWTMAHDGKFIYTTTDMSGTERTILAYNTTTNAHSRTYLITLDEDSASGRIVDLEYLGDNKFAALNYYTGPGGGTYKSNIHILQLNHSTPAPSAASAQAAPRHTPTMVKPLLLYYELSGDNTIKLVYNTTLNPHVIDELDYEMGNDEYYITAVNVVENYVYLTYYNVTPKPTSSPTVYAVGDVSYPSFEVSSPAPSPAPSIDFTVGGLDEAKIKLGSTHTFDVAITRVEGGGTAIILLTNQPDFVMVQNTEINRATITINASHASAVTGDYTFTVVAAAGSDPVRKTITVSIVP